MFGAPVDGRLLMPLARGEYCAEITGHPVIRSSGHPVFMIRRGDLKHIYCDSCPPSSMICTTIPGSVLTLLEDLLTQTLWTALPKKRRSDGTVTYYDKKVLTAKNHASR